MIVDIVLNERTVDLRYNECLCKGGSYNEVLSMTNDFFFTPVVVKYMEKYLDITKTRYSGQIWPVPWHFVISRLHCNYTDIVRTEHSLTLLLEIARPNLIVALTSKNNRTP